MEGDRAGFGTVAPAPPRSLKVGTLVSPLVNAVSDPGSTPGASIMTATAEPPSTNIIGPIVGGRWWSWLRQRRIFCYDPKHGGHHIPATFRIPEHGFIRCDKWLGDEKRECGRWVYLCAMRGGGVIAAEVHLSELKYVETLQTPTEVLDHLGVWRDGE